MIFVALTVGVTGKIIGFVWHTDTHMSLITRTGRNVINVGGCGHRETMLSAIAVEAIAAKIFNIGRTILRIAIPTTIRFSDIHVQCHGDILQTQVPGHVAILKENILCVLYKRVEWI